MTPLPHNFFKNDCKNGFNFKDFFITCMTPGVRIDAVGQR